VIEIEYRATYGNGDTEQISVNARDTNSGFAKALKKAMEPLGNGQRRELNKIEFWRVWS
jgi:hypothetical protein